MRKNIREEFNTADCDDTKKKHNADWLTILRHNPIENECWIVKKNEKTKKKKIQPYRQWYKD